jgi:hypothetical protein
VRGPALELARQAIGKLVGADDVELGPVHDEVDAGAATLTAA